MSVAKRMIEEQMAENDRQHGLDHTMPPEHRAAWEKIEAQARRFKAAVNAVEGIGTEALESGALGELVNTCREILRDRTLLDGRDPTAHGDLMAILSRLDS